MNYYWLACTGIQRLLVVSKDTGWWLLGRSCLWWGWGDGGVGGFRGVWGQKCVLGCNRIGKDIYQNVIGYARYVRMY